MRQNGAPLSYWQRNFRAVWPSLFVVSAGMMAFVPMLPLYVRERFGLAGGDLELWAGLIYGAAPLSAALIGPLWGVLGDRRGRKPMALRAVLGIALVVGLMPLARTPLQLLGLRLAQGTLAGYIAPAMALVSADLPEERQGRTLGQLQVAVALGMLCGPWLGAEIALRFGFDAVFHVTAGCAFLSSLPVLLFARESRDTLARDGARAGVSGFFASVLGFLVSPRVLPLLGVVFAVRFAQVMVEAFLALHIDWLGPLPWLAHDGVGREDAVKRTVSWMFVVVALGQIAFTPRWGRLGDRLGPLRALAFGSAALGLLLVVLASVRDVVWFFGLRCVCAAVMAGGMALSYAAVQKRIEARQRAMAFACVQSFMQLGMFSGPLVGGVVARFAGLPGVFVAAGFASLGAALAIVALRRGERRAGVAATAASPLRSDPRQGT
ncbi:MAG: MFS transporter [Planctomycetes bacterium]|nr:MFS transporter [Planctomycetota bacterium]